MNDKERVNLMRALIRAKNAFCDSLEKDGYNLGYPIGGMSEKKARILKKKEGEPVPTFVGIGDVIIRWSFDDFSQE